MDDSHGVAMLKCLKDLGEDLSIPGLINFALLIVYLFRSVKLNDLINEIPIGTVLHNQVKESGVDVCFIVLNNVRVI